MCKIDGSVIISLDGVGSRLFLGTWLSNAAEFQCNTAVLDQCKFAKISDILHSKVLLNDSSFCLWIFELLSLVFEMVGEFAVQ